MSLEGDFLHPGHGISLSGQHPFADQFDGDWAIQERESLACVTADHPFPGFRGTHLYSGFA
jgi:hypothetical protein